MSFSADLLGEIAEFEAFGRWRQVTTAASTPHEFDPDDMRALSLLRSEILHVAALTCAVTSLTNALESGIFSHIPVRAIEPFSPSYSSAFLASIQVLSEQPKFFALQQHWQATSAAQSVALQLSRLMMLSHYGPDESAICHVDILADA